MIKLIASDIDGTLVEDGSASISQELLETISALTDSGITFVAASGRSVVSLEKLFEPIRDKICYIACNGTYMGRYDAPLFTISIKREWVKELVLDARKYEECTLFLNSAKRIYSETKKQEVLDWMKNGYRENVVQVEDLSEVEDEIIKICLYDPARQAGTTAKGLYEKWHDKLSVVTAGSMWMDFFSLKANKGEALKRFQKSLNVTPKETMAFGDQQNDIQMLKQAYYSYAIGNALPEVKKVTRFVADTNQNGGVLKILKTLL